MKKKATITSNQELLERPLWGLSVMEFLSVLSEAGKLQEDGALWLLSSKRITGVKALAKYLNCSESTIYLLRRKGVLDGAVISQIGRRIVFDGDKARTLASEYMKENRKKDNI